MWNTFCLDLGMCNVALCAVLYCKWDSGLSFLRACTLQVFRLSGSRLYAYNEYVPGQFVSVANTISLAAFVALDLVSF